MGDYANDTWAYEELIPFLLTVFGDREGYQWRGIGDWETSIEIAERNLNRIPFYEDFPSTIERVRLSLINPSVLTPAEEQKYMRLATGNAQVLVSIFVRHEIRRGPYRLYSLGPDPSPNFPRARKDDPHSRPATDAPLQTTTFRLPGVVGHNETFLDDYTHSSYGNDTPDKLPTGASQDRRLNKENYGAHVGAHNMLQQQQQMGSQYASLGRLPQYIRP